jgi:hypothetical protein
MTAIPIREAHIFIQTLQESRWLELQPSPSHCRGPAGTHGCTYCSSLATKPEAVSSDQSAESAICALCLAGEGRSDAARMSSRGRRCGTVWPRDSGILVPNIRGEISALFHKAGLDALPVDLARFGPRRRAVSDADHPPFAGMKRAGLNRRSSATTCWLRGS